MEGYTLKSSYIQLGVGDTGDGRVRNKNRDSQRNLVGGLQTVYYNVLGNNQHHISYVPAKNKHTESNHKEMSEKAK